MTRHPLAAAALVAGGLLSSSCMTIDTRLDPDPGASSLFSGTRRDVGYVLKGFVRGHIGFVVVGIADLPFSMLADTLLLPWTLSEERGRRRVAAPTPNPAEEQLAAARAFFEGCQKQMQELEAAFADCYAETARVEIREKAAELRVDGARYREHVRERLAAGRRRGDYLTFKEVSYALEGDGVRVAAVRVSAFSRERRPASFLLREIAPGEWRIVEETGAGWPPPQ